MRHKLPLSSAVFALILAFGPLAKADTQDGNGQDPPEVQSSTLMQADSSLTTDLATDAMNLLIQVALL